MVDCRGQMAGTSTSGRRPDPRLWRLDLRRECDGGIVIIEVAGRLGAESSGRLIEGVLPETQGERPRILLDLAAVDYVSSAGLTALDAIAGRVHSVQGALVVCSLTDAVRLVFELSGRDAEFTIAATRANGLALLR